MASIGTLSVILSASASPFLSALRSVENSVSGFAGTIRSQLGGATSYFGVQLSGLPGLAAGAFGAIASGAVKAAADFEQLGLTFETLAGGAEQGKKLLGDLTDLAARTPFQLNDLTKASQTLLSYGFNAEQAFGIVSRMGDVAAASTEGQAAGLDRIAVALGQIKSLSVTHTQELKQLAEVGIGSFDAVAKRLGVDTATAMKMVEMGQVDAATGIAAILDLADSPKYKGLMARQGQTLNGLVSTMQDSVAGVMRDLGATLIEGFDLKGGVRALTAFIDQLRTSLDGLRGPLLIVGQLFGVLRDTALTGLRYVVDTLRGWGLNIDASKEKLSGLREMAVSFVESAAQSVNRFLNQVVRFGGVFLDSVVAPFLEGLSAVLMAIRNMFASGTFKNLEAAGLARNAAVDIERVAFKLRLNAQGLMEKPLDDGADAVKGFFEKVRQAPFQAVINQFNGIRDSVLGVRGALAGGDPLQAFGTLVGGIVGAGLGAGLLRPGVPPVNLGGAGMAAMKELKVPPALLAGQKDTVAAINAAVGGVAAKPNDLAAILRDNVKGVRDTVAAVRVLIEEVRKNGIGVLAG